MLDIQGLQNTIVGPISLRIAPGRCATISGASGSGKSLFLRMIADLDPHAGSVRLGDLDRATVPAPHWRRRVSYIPAEAGWWSEIVRDHVRSDSHRQAEGLATRLSLDPSILDRAVRLLSTGERQRLALVRALVAAPKVLLLDEPTSALDPSATSEVETLLREALLAGAIIMMVTHHRAQGDRLGDQRHVMTAGRLAPR